MLLKDVLKNLKNLNQFIKEVCDSNRISEEMKNNFGNYFIQKEFKLCNGEDKKICAIYRKKYL